jgi:hypothetical protein
VELGLGIDRRLNEDLSRQKQELLAPGEVSFWYLANHLGRRFLPEARRRLGELQPLGEGLWRCEVLERLVFLVSVDTLPVDRDSVPLHLLSQEPPERERAVAQLVAGQADFWRRYSAWLAFLHPAIWEEAQQMARANGIETTLDLRPLIEMVGVEQVIAQVGIDRVLAHMGAAQILPRLGIDDLVANLTPEQRQQLLARLQRPGGADEPKNPPTP